MYIGDRIKLYFIGVPADGGLEADDTGEVNNPQGDGQGIGNGVTGLGDGEGVSDGLAVEGQLEKKEEKGQYPTDKRSDFI